MINSVSNNFQGHRQEVRDGRVHLPPLLLRVHVDTSGVQGRQRGADSARDQAEDPHHVHDRLAPVAAPASRQLQAAPAPLPRDW